MAARKPLLDEYGVIYEAVKKLPDQLKLEFLEAIAELEDSDCHKHRSFPKTRLHRVRGLSDTAAGLPTAALADEILLPGDGQVKALFCIGGNPMAAWPDQRRTEAAIRKLDLLVSLDMKRSATARPVVVVVLTAMRRSGRSARSSRMKCIFTWAVA